uniref:Uncharacterized protein n=1 Tax=Plectus sambesii TaxID=2011161 RepID=A0A914V513_9BILA
MLGGGSAVDRSARISMLGRRGRVRGGAVVIGPSAGAFRLSLSAVGALISGIAKTRPPGFWATSGRCDVFQSEAAGDKRFVETNRANGANGIRRSRRGQCQTEQLVPSIVGARKRAFQPANAKQSGLANWPIRTRLLIVPMGRPPVAQVTGDETWSWLSEQSRSGTDAI